MASLHLSALIYIRYLPTHSGLGLPSPFWNTPVSSTSSFGTFADLQAHQHEEGEHPVEEQEAVGQGQEEVPPHPLLRRRLQRRHAQAPCE